MDELQRRIRGADPLTAAEGWTPNAARLDTIKEQIMQTEVRPVRVAFRPRRLGLATVGAAALATVLLVGTLARPATTTLAWSASPSAVTDAQLLAAGNACVSGATSIGSTGSGSEPTRVGEAPAKALAPADLPPVVSLELHGTGGIAILADENTVGYCLVRLDGDRFVYGGLAVGGIESAPGGSLVTGAMGTSFDGVDLGMIWGTAPAGVTQIRVDGGAGDGGIATVSDGRFAIWIPGPLMSADVALVALDPSGAEVLRQDLMGARPVEGEATPDASARPVEGEATPEP